MISIVVPAYNVSPYIERSVKSVIAQTFNDWELIAIDDGSNDDTWQKLQKLATLDSRIKVFTQPNQGVVKTRENAVAKASGEYLFFLDGDDYLPDNSLELLIKKAETENADIVIGSYTLVWENGKEVFINNLKDYNDPSSALEYCLDHNETFIPIKLYRRKIYFESVKIPHSVFSQEDTIAICQFLGKSSNVSFVTDNIYYYYKHSRSVTMNSGGDRLVGNLLTVNESIQKIDRWKSDKIKTKLDLFCVMNLYACASRHDISSQDFIRIRAISQNFEWEKIYSLSVSMMQKVKIKSMKLFIINRDKKLLYTTVRIEDFMRSIKRFAKKLLH